MKSLIFFVATILSLKICEATPQKRDGFSWGSLRSWAIQDRGRIKPYDTFARESVLYVTGKNKWKGLNANEVTFGWLVSLDKEWRDEEFIRVDYKPLKDALGLEVKRQYFRPEELDTLPALDKMLREAGQKESRKERLSNLEKKAIELQNKKNLLESIVGGNSLVVLPNPKGVQEPWFPLSALTDGGELPYGTEMRDSFALSLRKMVDAYLNKDATQWNASSLEVEKLLRQDLAQGKYPSTPELNREIHYNQLRPFRLAWIVYTLALILLVAGLVAHRPRFNQLGLICLFGGFLIHTYGFGLRCWISGRPPVTNMYESVVWVTWGCVLFSLIIWAAYKNIVIPTASVVFSIAGLVLADNLPSVLDPGIHPLVPVLRSNFWLTIHVLCITLSYAAFAVSTCLGNLNLGFYIFKPTQSETIQQNIIFMYRAMQIGVILLAAGTILGGVWADYSWGRFWGWDPKEVWALIALLFYIAVLHGRFTGWLKGFGFVAATVLSFLGVVMAWYGVNFVLGVGLHSYGFGSGGLSYVVGYLIAQVALVLVSYRQFGKAGKPGNQFIAPRTGI
ncbi:MAG: cytochrome c biogenesis protein [Pseudomonadota bacterium]